MNLTFLSRIPFIKRWLIARLCDSIAKSLSGDNTTAVFFPETYALQDNDAIQNALAKRDPSWEIGFITVNTGNGMMTVFFVAKTLQLLWDSVSLYKNVLSDRWLAFHINIYMHVIRKEAARRNVPLITDEVYL